MKKICFETLVPDELLSAVRGRSLVIQPIGSMEWHGPHMGMGMDTYNAREVAMRVARRLDGIVMPPLFIGTETPRSPETLRRLGFDGTERIVGMDFPNNSVRSFYWPSDLFEIIVERQARMLLELGFQQLLLLNGHGADAQIAALERISEKLSAEYDRCVTTFMALAKGCGVGLGHAGLAETAIFSRLCPEAVELEKLPPRDVPLRNVEFAIVDSETFSDGPNDDYTVRYDPRDATPELGERIIQFTSERCAEQVEAAYRAYRSKQA